MSTQATETTPARETTTSKMPVMLTPEDVALYESVRQFLYREARALDERRFEDWIEFFTEDAVFWMPAWDVDEELTRDPQTEISLIYYPNRAGLEDRIFRIRTERSSATSLPDPRTSHNVNDVEILDRREGEVDIRFTWNTAYFRYNTTDTYYGWSEYTLSTENDDLRIKYKKVVLMNDFIHHVVDVYMV